MTAQPGDIDLRQLCSHCGVCCTGTYLLWFTTGDRRQSAEIDRPTLDAVFERSFGPDAPALVQEWNAAAGWTDAAGGAATDADELVALLERHGPELDDDGRIARLAAFVREARAAGAPMYIRDD